MYGRPTQNKSTGPQDIPKTQLGDYISLNLDPESDLDLTGTASKKSFLSGIIHPFHKSHTTVLGQFHEEFKSLLAKKDVRLATLLVIVGFFVTAILASWCSSTNSLALRAYNYITMFELLCLLTYIVSAWAVRQDQRSNAHSSYTLGFERLEVLAVFSSVVIAQLGGIFIIKEAAERIIEQPEIHAGRLLPGALLALLFHIATNYFIVNHAFASISEVAASSWVQEHVADMSRGICGVVPILKTFLLPRVNPFFLVSFSAGCGVLLVDVLLQIDFYYIADTLVGLCVAVVTIGTMWPILMCSGRVLLHTTPPHVLGQLDKLLSEAQTLDGVLEVKSEKFYTLSLGLRGRQNGRPALNLAGSLQVRVRRDADEQMVLAHVTNRLSPLVPLLTVQVLKDDWTSASAIGPLSAKLPQQTSPLPGFTKNTSHFISGFNKPAAAVAPYLQTPPCKPPLPIGPPKPFERQFISKELQTLERKDDFCFSSPLKSTPANSQVKPRSSQTDIARMYKAAGFKTVPSGSGPFRYHGSSFSHLKSSPSLLSYSKEASRVSSLSSLTGSSTSDSFSKP